LGRPRSHLNIFEGFAGVIAEVGLDLVDTDCGDGDDVGKLVGDLDAGAIDGAL
jgi:hypothetical protein